MHTRVPLGVIKNVLKLDRVGGCTHMLNVLNATKLFIFKWLILYYIDFPSTEGKNKQMVSASTNFLCFAFPLSARDEDVMPRKAAAVFSAEGQNNSNNNS